jgi:hypothetical protein
MTDERKRELLATLEKWTDAVATLWTYSATHSQLELRLERPASRGNLHLICSGCVRVEARTTWSHAKLRFVERIGPPETGRCELVDLDAGVHIICEMIRVEANVEPVFSRHE